MKQALSSIKRGLYLLIGLSLILGWILPAHAQTAVNFDPLNPVGGENSTFNAPGINTTPISPIGSASSGAGSSSPTTTSPNSSQGSSPAGSASNQAAANGTGSATNSNPAANGGILSSLNIIPPCLRGDSTETTTSLSSCLLGTSSSPDGLVYWVDLLLIITMIAAFIYILLGAYQMVTAFGEEAKFTTGRKTVTYATVGVIVAILALTIVNLFISLLHGTTVTAF